MTAATAVRLAKAIKDARDTRDSYGSELSLLANAGQLDMTRETHRERMDSFRDAEKDVARLEAIFEADFGS